MFLLSYYFLSYTANDFYQIGFKLDFIVYWIYFVYLITFLKTLVIDDISFWGSFEI